MIPLLSDFQVLSGSIMIYGCRILIQSTLLIAFGLFAARMLKHRGAALQSSILRITLVALPSVSLDRQHRQLRFAGYPNPSKLSNLFTRFNPIVLG